MGLGATKNVLLRFSFIYCILDGKYLWWLLSLCQQPGVGGEALGHLVLRHFRPPVGMRWELRRTASELTHFSPQADDRLSEKEMEDLTAWMRNALGSRVTNVKVRPAGDRPLLGRRGSSDRTAG